MLSAMRLQVARLVLARSSALLRSTQQLPSSRALCRRSFSVSSVSQRRQIRAKPPSAPPPPPPSGPQEWDAAALAARLYRLLAADERAQAVSEQSAAAALGHLRELSFTEAEVSELVLGCPALLRRGPAAWRAAVPALLERGCTPQQAAAILATCPAVLDCSRRQLEEVFAVLEGGLAADDAAQRELLVRQPLLLLQPAGRLQQQLRELLAVFTPAQASRVALRCPTVLLERPEDTRRKIDYLMETMGLTPADIAHSSAMAFALEHVRTRHVFLERSGTYVRPGPKDTAPSGNPALTEIVDHSDELFCQRVAKMPYREYEVFSRMLQEELEEAAELEEESDSDFDEPPGYGTKGKRNR